jgi:hypothetical protein
MAHALTVVPVFPTSPIVMPDDGDDLVEASVEPAFQSLANGMLYVKHAVDGTGTPTTYRRLVPASKAASISGTWAYSQTLGLWSALNATAADVLVYNFQIPHGGVLTGIYGGVRINGGSPSVGMKMAAHLVTMDKTGVAGPNTAAVLGTLQTSTLSTSPQNPLAITGLSQAFDASTNMISVEILTSDSNSGANADMVLWVDAEFTHTDPKAGLVTL